MLTSLSDTLLATALLLIVVSAIQPLARRLMLSATVLLAGVGILLGGGAALVLNAKHAQAFDDAARALLDFPVNADAFLYVFLPLLVFHGSLSIDVRRLARDWVTVLVMAVVAVLVTTAAVGFALHSIAGISLTACLMLGAIVATTDPSAVVAIFREIGANGRLTRLVEGESLLNDAAAISIFTILLAQITSHQAAAPLAAAIGFLGSFVGGIASWIRDNKGPLPYDRRLLIPAGNAIMEGLGKGLEDKLGMLKHVLENVTDTMTDTVTDAFAKNKMYLAGADAALGLADGLRSNKGAVVKALSAVMPEASSSISATLVRSATSPERGRTTDPQAAAGTVIEAGAIVVQTPTKDPTIVASKVIDEFANYSNL